MYVLYIHCLGKFYETFNKKNLPWTNPDVLRIWPGDKQRLTGSLKRDE